MKQITHILVCLLVVLGCCVPPGICASFKIASYNIENLFDLNSDGTEYPDYIPNGPHGWDSKQLDIKLNNIASVIKDLDADIIALQEVESVNALTLLQNRLLLLGAKYPFSAISMGRITPVRCAVLSRFPINGQKEIHAGNGNERDILKVLIDIEGNTLIIYVNHWKSKAGPESKRVKYAAALSADFSQLACNADVVLIGDFNSDYNEYETFRNVSRLNDTRGITGINHIINTVKDREMVGESLLSNQEDCEYVYNLWLEIPESRRWSVNFFGQKNSPDSIIVSKALYDSTGISYVDNSFDKFDPDYLFDNSKVFRWQRTKRGKGRHLGKGYSDHLPVFAEFSTQPFCIALQKNLIFSEPKALDIAGLYTLKKGVVNVRINNAVVIYKEHDSAVIKQKGGRGIYIYKAAKELKYAMTYDLTVTYLNRHYGNLEVTGIKDIDLLDPKADMKAYYIDSLSPGLENPQLRNEVIEQINGVYENGWLHYDSERRIRLYFSNPALKPEDFSIITLFHVRIGFHRHPEIIVENENQVRMQ